MTRPLIAVTCSFRDTAEGPWSGQHSVGHPYMLSLQGAGGTPLLVPGYDDDDEIRRVLELADGLLVTGGADFDPRAYGEQPDAKFGSVSPERDRLDRISIEWALERPDLPVMGICRGIQSINVVAGGTLIQDVPSQVEGALKHAQNGPMYYGTHDIEVSEGSRLREIVGAGRISVNSSHHQAVREPAPGWQVVARADDGVAEAIERTDGGWGLGCQFHPEAMVPRDPRMAAIFEAFVEACRR